MPRRELYLRGKRIFLEAIALDGPAREEVLARECGADRELRAVVDGLLANDSGTEGPWRGAALPAGADPAEAPIPPEIDGHRILRLLGAGGMGAVYEAEQPNPRRIVALKVLRAELVSAASLRRFELEAETLGRLEHPGIARIYGSGRTALGTPYFIMERIEGETLLDSARAQGLGTRERIGLFARVCDAVHHAHQSGIIHRDLKPSNVLVGADRVPKVLDFGIARSIDDGARTRGIATLEGQLLGTVPYMSPEQTLGEGARIDTRSDIYSLGVMLHELLAGDLPYRPADTSLYEMLRSIRETAPTPLGGVDRALRGDVETIVRKALEKDPERRYESAAELGADLRRSLAHEPITATPPSAVYRLRKFARRHSLLVAAAMLVAATLIVAAVVSSYWALAARRESANAKAISEFLGSDWVEAIDPELGDREITMREVLDRAAAAIGARFADEPLVEASLRHTLGRTYDRLGEVELAAPHLERARAIYLAELGPRAPQSADVAADLALVRSGQGREEEAESLLRGALAATIRQDGEGSERAAMALNKLGAITKVAGRHAEALDLLRRARAAERAARAAAGEGIGMLALIIAGNEAHTLLLAGEVAAAEEAYVAALAEAEPLFPDFPFREAPLVQGLAQVRIEQDRLDEAEELLGRAIALRESMQGERHPDTAEARLLLAGVHAERGRLDRAEPLARRAIADLEAARGPAHRSVLIARSDLGSALLAGGRPAPAAAELRAALELAREHLGERDPATIRTKQALGTALGNLGEREEGLVLLQEALAAQLRHSGPEHPDSLTMALNVGVALHRLSRLEEAESMLEPVVRTRIETSGEAHADTIAAMDALALVRFALGEGEAATALLERALAARAASGDGDCIESVRAANNLGYHFLKDRRFAEALPHLDAAFRAQGRIAPEHPNIVFMAINLGRAQHGLGRHDDAIETFREGIERLSAISPERDGRYLTLLEGIGLAHQAAGRFAEAETVLLELHDECARLFGDDHRNARTAAGRVAAFYEAWGKPDEALLWRSRASLE